MDITSNLKYSQWFKNSVSAISYIFTCPSSYVDIHFDVNNSNLRKKKSSWNVKKMLKFNPVHLIQTVVKQTKNG